MYDIKREGGGLKVVSLCCFSPKDIDIADRVPILAAALDIRYHQLTFLDVRQQSIAYGALKEKCKVAWEEQHRQEY